MNSSARRDLPTPGGADDRDQRHAGRCGASKASRSRRSSPLATDQRHGRPRSTSAARPGSRTAARPRTRLALPFTASGSTSSASTASRTSAIRLGADQDLAGPRRLLQPRSDVDRVAVASRSAVPGDHLARVHADAERESRPSRRSSSFSVAIAARSSTAARTARRASSSCSTGTRRRPSPRRR